MLTTIEHDLSQLFGQAFADNDLSFDFGATVRCTRPELGDFQCNGAMAAAKQGAGNPFVAAEKVVASLADNDIIKNIEVTSKNQ